MILDLAFLAGLFGAPATLLWLGHHMRDRSPRLKGAFWGGLIGHSATLVLTVVLALAPPVAWTDDAWRGFAVHSAMLAGFLAGAALGAARRRPAVLP